MLLKSTNRNEKIVLGLLSLIHLADEEITRPMELLEVYREKEDFEIYLYRDIDSQNFVGLVAAEHRFDQVEKTDQDELNDAAENNDVTQNEKVEVQETIVINQLSVIPSFEDEGIEQRMYAELRQMFPNAQVIGSLDHQTLDTVTNLAIAYQQEHE